ncbi:hypothetical protein N7535_008659 [Penicillium sp. DV-2018c]|nr:hypothetical protein N7461_002420 [Penicillium sp. DV-2018c]KAJ5563495.1 hypothetical protein N7535_008659 [Penicillium sp. DV-2018c]
MDKPEKSSTDIFMSINPKAVNDIARGKKTHVHRNYPLPSTVRRIWFYTTTPMHMIEYVVCISHDVQSTVNVDGKHSTYRYQIQQVWMLKRVIGLREAVARGIFKAAPRKYCWATEEFLESRPFGRQYPLRGL